MAENKDYNEVREIREKLGLTQKELADKLGVAEKTVQNWEYGRKIAGTNAKRLRDLVVKPQRYAGGGEQTNVHGNNINGNNVTVNQPDTMDKLLEMLAMKEASLVKAQEHIDKLLEIIGNITRNDKGSTL